MALKKTFKNLNFPSVQIYYECLYKIILLSTKNLNKVFTNLTIFHLNSDDDAMIFCTFFIYER